MSTQFTNRQWRLPNNENKDKQSNYSMDFDGSSQYIDLGESVLHTSSATVFTLSAWIKPKAGMSLGIIAADAPAASPTNGGFWIGYDNRNTATRPANGISYNIKTSTGSQSGKSNDNAITLNAWNHVVLVLDGQATLYINGVSSTNRLNDNVGDLVTQSHELLIGTEDTLTFEFNGQIDAVSIYNYALSLSQITTLYGSSSTGIGNPMSLSPKPVAYYPLGDQDAFNGADYLVPNSSLKDYVFDFDGSSSSQRVSFTTPSAFYGVNLNNFNCTMSIWGKFSAINQFDALISFGVYDLEIAPVTNTAVGIWVNDAILTGFSYTPTMNVWNHYVLTKSGNTYSLYVDGNLIGSGSDPDNAVIGSTSYLASNGSLNYFNGELSNAQVFNTALPATGSNSVETLYNNGSPLTSMSGFTSLQGWWKLDASATFDSSTNTWTIPDDSTNSNDGTSFGMTQANLVQSDLSFTSGYSPYALEFDGADDYIDLNFQSQTTPATISIWVNTDVNDSQQRYAIINGRADQIPYLFLRMATDNTYQLLFYNSNGSDTLQGSSATINTWFHFAIVCENSQTLLYENGVLKDSSTIGWNGIDIDQSNNWQLGRDSRGQRYWNGKLSNASIWNAALTSAQVSEIYSEGVPQNLLNHSAVSSLVSWWQLGSNSSFNTNWTVLDEKGSNNGTSVNMTEADIVDGVGSYANGLSSGMGGDEVIGSAPFSDANSLSINMDVLDRVEDTPS